MIKAQIAVRIRIAAFGSSLAFLPMLAPGILAGGSPLDAWLAPQIWIKDATGAVVSLGQPGDFDDTHIFAPCVARLNDQFFLWYCGSRGEVAKRVFRLGLATSREGIHFEKSPRSPVFSFNHQNHSVLTPTLLKNTDGTPIREEGNLRMWFSAADFPSGGGLHTLHESHSPDGISWSNPSPPLLEHVYAPTLLKVDEVYRMWFADVSKEPWVIRHASSPNGRDWSPDSKPVIEINQDWESRRLFYPFVVKIEDAYLMWYGSYWSEHEAKTAIGFAVSDDGLQWVKHPDNPVLRPDPDRSWESHYTTSQSVIRLPDGSWRMWYATRKEPPFVNKYFAIGTAIWKPASDLP